MNSDPSERVDEVLAGHEGERMEAEPSRVEEGRMETLESEKSVQTETPCKIFFIYFYSYSSIKSSMKVDC